MSNKMNELKLCTWNVNGLAEWKEQYKEFIELLNKNDIVCITESWKNETQVKLLEREVSNTFSIIYSCRRKNKRAKRDSGGIVVFIKNYLSGCIKTKDISDEDIIWLTVDKLYTNYLMDTFVGCSYISPKTSCRYADDDRSKLDIVREGIIKYKDKGHVMLMGDLNCRTGTADDYIPNDESTNFINIPIDIPTIEIDDIISNGTVNILKSRISPDKLLNEYGRELLAICKSNNMFIVNGQIGDSPDGNFTCHTSNGQSVVDYFIVDSELLSNVTEFSVGQDNPLSDHNYLMTKIRTVKCVNIDTCSTVVTKTFYRWSIKI